MLDRSNFWEFLAAVSGSMGVIMGAVAAHAVPEATLASMAKEASVYQIVHAVILFLIARRSGTPFLIARWLFLIGMVFFSGSLYVKALTDVSLVTAPLGGTALILGWLLLAAGSLRFRNTTVG